MVKRNSVKHWKWDMWVSVAVAIVFSLNGAFYLWNAIKNRGLVTSSAVSIVNGRVVNQTVATTRIGRLNYMHLMFGMVALLASAVGIVRCMGVGKRLRRWNLGRCVRCGYDLRGTTERRCPECGEDYEVLPATASLQVP